MQESTTKYWEMSVSSNYSTPVVNDLTKYYKNGDKIVRETG